MAGYWTLLLNMLKTCSLYIFAIPKRYHIRTWTASANHNPCIHIINIEYNVFPTAVFSAILLNRVIVNLERENFVQNEYKDLLGHPRLQFLVSTGYGSIPRTEEHEKV